jgi:protein involved in polysaccharide export with SLBB domain
VQVADVLQVRFFRTPELTQTVTVGPDGATTLALVGSVYAAGRTVDDLTEIVRVLYADADLLDPQITISVQAYSGMRVYVAGEVNTPGMLDYHGGLTLVQAIMQAGGFLNTARLSHVLVIRRGSEGQPLGSLVDVGEILTDGSFGADIALAPSDIVFVPRSVIANINLFVDQYILNMLPQPFFWLGYDVLVRD